jgi:uncharacterized membrane protein
MYRFTCQKCNIIVIRKSNKGRKPIYCDTCRKIVQSSQVRKNYMTQNREQYKSVYKESGVSAYAKHKDK